MKFLIFLLALAGVTTIYATVEFTNVKCESFDKTYASFPYCYLRSVNRTYKYLSLRANIHKVPIDNATIRIRFWKFANGYKPFLYNLNVDGCRFLQKSNNKVLQFIYGFFKPYSNINHTCPYDHDLLVEKLPISHIDHLVTNVLPVPRGQYLFDTVWATYNVERVAFKLYVTLS